MVQFSVRTDAGRVRSGNEDNFLVDRKLKLFVVCDGLGGHHGGEIASATAVNVVREQVVMRRNVIERFEAEDGVSEQEVIALLREAVVAANHRIHERARHNPSHRGMGTTLSLLLIAGARAFVAHVGDTRIYRLRQGSLAQVTEDHSLFTEMQRGLQMTQEQLDRLDGRIKNQITRAVGVHQAVDVDVTALEVRAGDRYLLCSDGLHGLVDDPSIAVAMGGEDITGIADRLVDEANGAGGRDNITALLVALEPATSPAGRRRAWPTFDVARSVELFRHLGDEDMERLIARVREIKVDVGAPLVVELHRPGALAGLYLVIAGELQAWRDREVIATLRPGDHFGEEALLLELISPATVIASGEGQALVALMTRDAFEDLQRAHPDTALKIAVALGRALARKVEASAREASPHLLYRAPTAMTRPHPRPVNKGRVLVDTEPEGPVRFPTPMSGLEETAEHEALPAEPPPLPSSAPVLRRPRTHHQRVYPAPTQPDPGPTTGPETARRLTRPLDHGGYLPVAEAAPPPLPKTPSRAHEK